MDSKFSVSTAFERFGLTPAEAKLALAIGEGQNLRDFADGHDISLHTVRNQLKSVFAKTGVSRQIELALLIHRLRN